MINGPAEAGHDRRCGQRRRRGGLFVFDDTVETPVLLLGDGKARTRVPIELRR